MIAERIRYELNEWLILVTLVSASFIGLSALSGDYILYIIPGVTGVVFLGYLLIINPSWFPLLYLLGSILFLENEPGIQPLELPFYALNIIAAAYLCFDIVRGNLKLKTTLDYLFLLYLLLIPYGISLGILHGAAPFKVVGEVTYFFGLFIYFILRKYMHDEGFQKKVFFIVGLILTYILIRNALNYQALLIQAVAPWELELARSAANELFIVLGASFFLAATATTKSRWLQLIYTGTFIAFVGGLILTQSRGYWLAFFLAAVVIFIYLNNKGKLRLLISFLVLSAISILIAKIFFGDLYDFISQALIDRVSSIGSTFSGKLDLSLRERVLESQSVFEKISDNPIVGHGWATTYTKNNIFQDFFFQTSYVHNGYLAGWYKFGIFGLGIILSVWFYIIRYAYVIYSTSKHQMHRVSALTIFSVTIGMLLVNITSPQILAYDSMLITVIMGCFCSTQYSQIQSESDGG
ncbi:O-antigen ligase family protein [Gracilimonas mengyeensis]|uniref:O-antigen ligase n=1 Tax=Gracilimonas mengyeensis TaxID=1302730 RepID=A0A521DHU2_9BACT|nr:O-antigen ligase family protein [Gracilimonas mengyeensis]SMO70490.1 O-antigen ligase [Gracilimonas mengyeensis]